MNKVIRKWFWVWQQDAERAFLQQMSREGLRLVNVRFITYIFEECPPAERHYQMDFRGLDIKMPEAEYLQICQKAGWTFVTKGNGWHYFSRDDTVGVSDSIFCAVAQGKTYKRLLVFLLLTGLPLYYQVIFIFPRLPSGSAFYPFSLFLVGIMFFHLFAVLKVLQMHKRTAALVKE